MIEDQLHKHTVPSLTQLARELVESTVWAETEGVSNKQRAITISMPPR